MGGKQFFSLKKNDSVYILITHILLYALAFFFMLDYASAVYYV